MRRLLFTLAVFLLLWGGTASAQPVPVIPGNGFKATVSGVLVWTGGFPSLNACNAAVAELRAALPAWNPTACAPTTLLTIDPPITGAFLGTTGEDRVGRGNQITANGTADWHLRLLSVPHDPATVRIEAFLEDGTPNGVWALPWNGTNWIIAKTFTAGTLDLWIEMPVGISVP
jgi:hypothetical protein